MMFKKDKIYFYFILCICIPNLTLAQNRLNLKGYLEKNWPEKQDNIVFHNLERDWYYLGGIGAGVEATKRISGLIGMATEIGYQRTGLDVRSVRWADAGNLDTSYFKLYWNSFKMPVQLQLIPRNITGNFSIFLGAGPVIGVNILEKSDHFIKKKIEDRSSMKLAYGISASAGINYKYPAIGTFGLSLIYNKFRNFEYIGILTRVDNITTPLHTKIYFSNISLRLSWGFLDK